MVSTHLPHIMEIYIKFIYIYINLFTIPLRYNYYNNTMYSNYTTAEEIYTIYLLHNIIY